MYQWMIFLKGEVLAFGGGESSVVPQVHPALTCCRNRLFTGPDGKEYVWKLTSRVCKVMYYLPFNFGVHTDFND